MDCFGFSIDYRFVVKRWIALGFVFFSIVFEHRAF